MMRVGFLQSAPIIGDLDGNRQRLLAQLTEVDADLIVAPELCQSGYVFTSREEATALAEPIPDGPTCAALRDVARARRMTLVAGVCERDGDRLYNSAVLVTPSADVQRYRKVHLFMEEKLWFEPGVEGFPVVEVDGVKIGLMVCYDWRFPEAARCLALAGADLIAHPANLVLHYCQEVMRARCIENRVFAVTANRVGTDARPDGRRATFTGQSQVVDPEGTVLVRASEREVESGVVEIDPAMAREKSFSPQNHVLLDRRPELYGALIEPPRR
ncbi:MAG: nitrilase-related carbon-nitrogen hydrolase [Candidatus Eiseniibacteriota bacterium]|jgi:predicted amidohydrolase